MTDDYDVYDEDEELRDTIRAHLEGRLNYFDYVQTLMMLGKSEDDVKDDVERIRAEIEAENAPKPKKRAKKAPKEEPKGEEPSEEEPKEGDPAPGQRICAGCGAMIDVDRDVSIEINGKPACQACFEKMTGIPAPGTEDPIGGTDEEDPQDGECVEDDQDDGDSEDYTADPADYEDDKADYAAELTADGHMGVRSEPAEEPESEIEDYGIGVDPDEIQEEPPSEDAESDETPSEEPPEEGSEDAESDETPSEEPPEEPPSEEHPAKDDGIEDFIESVYEDDPGSEPSPKPNPAAAIGAFISRIPKKPVRRHPKGSPDGDAGAKPPKGTKEKKEYDPESLMGKLDRWYKINFQNYVNLRTLSRNEDTGEFRMDLDLIKRKDLPRHAVVVTGEKHTYAVDRIRRSEWYYSNHDKSMVPPWEAQFTASDAALYMMSDKIDNALSINWTQQSSTLAENKKIILIAALGILGIVLFFMMRHR